MLPPPRCLSFVNKLRDWMGWSITQRLRSLNGRRLLLYQRLHQFRGQRSSGIKAMQFPILHTVRFDSIAFEVIASPSSAAVSNPTRLLVPIDRARASASVTFKYTHPDTQPPTLPLSPYDRNKSRRVVASTLFSSRHSSHAFRFIVSVMERSLA